MRTKTGIVLILLALLVACSPSREPIVKPQSVAPVEEAENKAAWFVEVANNGMTWLGPEDLSAMGIDPLEGPPELDLSIPTLPLQVEEGWGLLFFVPDASTRYAERMHLRANVGQTGIAMDTASLPKPGQGRDTGWGFVHRDWDEVYMPEAITETWVGESLYAPAFIDYRLNLPNAVPGPVTIDLHVWSHTDMAPEPDHHLALHWNGHQVGDWTWDGIGMQHLSTSWEIEQDEGHLTVEAPAMAGVDVSVAWIDGWDLTYMRRVAADGSIWQATAEGQDLGEAPGSRLIDVTDPSAPVDMGSADGVVGTVPGHRYWAGRPAMAQEPVAIRLADLLDLDRLAEVDYLVVAPHPFQAALDPLIEQRSSQGLTPAVVSPQAIYDTLGTGQPDPAAIQALVEALPDLHYLLLVGDGSVELGGYDGEAGALRVVMPLVKTHFLGETPADGLLGNNRVAVGRLPAASATEVSTMVNKILRWLARSTSPQVSFLSDDQSDFRAMSESLAALVPNEAIHIAAGDDDALDAALNALTSGPAWVNYTGHGSPLRLGPFLTREDSEAWGEPGVVVAWTCLAAHFAHPTEPSLAETWLRSDHGVVAFFGPTGETLTSQQQPFAEAFYRGLPSADRIGDAWLAALKTGLVDDVAAGYVLLGDPAMKVEW
jgi:hypothetical protein